MGSNDRPAEVSVTRDSSRKRWVALSLVDAGTCWHVAGLSKDRTPKRFAKRVFEEWIKHYGCRHLVLGQGGEFSGYFKQACDEYGIETAATTSHAAWQHGLAERHGGLLGTIFGTVCYQFKVTKKLAVSMALAACCQTQDSVMTRNGLSVEQAVFGRSLRFTEQWTVDNDDDVLVAVVVAHGLAWPCLSDQVCSEVTSSPWRCV